jgi:hypothetical protein
MNQQDFCYWLQGFAELNQDAPTPEQWESIKEHLALVFTKVTEPVLPPFPRPYQVGDVLGQPYYTPMPNLNPNIITC